MIATEWVKCTRFRRGRSYKCHLDSNCHAYTPDQIDFIAAYVIPTDTWYILPIEATNGQPDILLTPHNESSKYEEYREAWHLLQVNAEECHPERRNAIRFRNRVPESKDPYRHR